MRRAPRAGDRVGLGRVQWGRGAVGAGCDGREVVDGTEEKVRVGYRVCDLGLLHPQAVDVQMQSMALRGPDGEPQSGLESQGRAASMPRLAAETQVGGLGVGLVGGWGSGVRRRGMEGLVPCAGFVGVEPPQLHCSLDIVSPVACDASLQSCKQASQEFPPPAVGLDSPGP